MPADARASLWSTDRSRLLRYAAAIWIGFGLVQTAQSYLLARAAGRDWSLLRQLLTGMPWWLSWLALTPLIAWLVDRDPLGGRESWRPLVRHAALAVILVAVQLTVTAMVYWLTTSQFAGPATSMGNQVQRYFGSFFMESLVTCAGTAGVLMAIDFSRAMRDAALQRSRAEARAAVLEATAHRARLDALAMELNPHFLFNTLSAISGLIAQDRSRDARDVTQRLGGLLRQSLGTGNGTSHTVANEVALLEDYLFIQRTRFGDRLRATIDVADSARDCDVPIMLLQPLVENAVRHGVEPSETPVEVRVSIDRIGDGVRIVIADSGSGFRFGPDGRLPREGIGLGNTRERLSRLFGDAASLTLHNATTGGAEVVVTVPVAPIGRSGHA